MVTPSELDRAFKYGKAELTRRNARPVRCACCRVKQPTGKARRLWIDGHKRGFLGSCCSPKAGK